MTKAERLAAKIQRDKETLEKQTRQGTFGAAAVKRPCGKRTGKATTNGATRSGRWPMRRDCWRGAMRSLRGVCARA